MTYSPAELRALGVHDEMALLQNQVATLLHQLTETKNELKLTRQEMNSRFDTLSALTGNSDSMANPEVSIKSVLCIYQTG